MKKVKTMMMLKWFLCEKSNQSLLVKKIKSLKRRKKKSQNNELLGIISTDSCTHKVNRDKEPKTLYRLPEKKTCDNCSSKASV